PPPSSTLFPYTTLFRSDLRVGEPQGPRSQRDVVGMLGAGLSEVADLPTISNISIRQILMGGLAQKTAEEDIEETFVVGSRSTTRDRKSTRLNSSHLVIS